MMGKSLGIPMGLRCKQSWGTPLTNLRDHKAYKIQKSWLWLLSVPSKPTQSDLNITKLWHGLVTNELLVLEAQ